MMKILKLFILLVLLTVGGAAFAVTLPPFSFFGANELYEEGMDEIEYEVGTKVKGINYLLEENNESWGNSCSKGGLAEQAECQDCCGASWAADNYSDAGEVLYDTCMKMCGGGPSLPLGSVLCLLPFALGYGIYKRYNNKKVDC